MINPIVLEPFDRIMSGYQQVTAESLSITDTAKIVKQFESIGIDRYSLGDYCGDGYLHYYLETRVRQVPILRYKRYFLIPLLFRKNQTSARLFSEPYRLESFFDLLAWYLQFNPKKVIVNFEEWDEARQDHETIVGYIDAAYLAFRLSEILDGSGFPLSHFQNVEQFIEWNKIYHLIDDGGFGRHRKIFDEDNERNVSELHLILTIIKKRYPETEIFI